jgi:hypothetical protein
LGGRAGGGGILGGRRGLLAGLLFESAYIFIVDSVEAFITCPTNASEAP